MSAERKPLYHFWSPRYWPVWFGFALLRIVCLLPNAPALAIGRVIGRLAHRIGSKRRAIVRRNLELCFPDLPPEKRNALARRHFEALGMSLIETGLARWAKDDRLTSITSIDGLEHLQAALDTGNGVILLGAHFTTLEISGRVMRLKCPPFDAVYRRNRSEFITELLRTGRERSADTTIEKREIKTMVRSLRNGRIVWYAPDQSYRGKGAQVVRFFGVPTMHTTATSTLARLGKAVVLPYFSRRSDDGRYEITIFPALPEFPSDDPVADTEKYVEALEAFIRTCPDQYYWIHRKFKDLPENYPDYYAELDALK
ncbi:LpxL/LpxP family Kdo(2)-lipid IV(A) lauroyl/palmitoleoyl acyltransferase [Gammaproteobacteria bacterium]|jgi:KDO2-lipid IV(A) lauroyltransferase|nr:LpxL/LpxP family Kdo(2)-lipid IV(A) lauroyl/palmitoleoyl acyltransferase [Gammaproteobacteria bacterium]